MNIKLYDKPVMTRFVVLDEKEFPLSDVYVSLEQISNTMEDDHWGDYSLRDYQLHSQEVMDHLVKMGLVKNYTGSRMANLYCMRNANVIERLQNVLYKLDKADVTPVADVREVIHGKWKFDSYTAKYGNPYRCSECGEEHADTYQYCPNCGANMDIE